MRAMRERRLPLEKSYMAKIGEADRIWDQLVTRVPEHLLWELERLVFVLIKPDAIAMGVHREVLKSIESRGWNVLSARTIVNPHPKSFEDLYSFNLTSRNEQNQIGIWWLNSQVG